MLTSSPPPGPSKPEGPCSVWNWRPVPGCQSRPWEFRWPSEKTEIPGTDCRRESSRRDSNAASSRRGNPSSARSRASSRRPSSRRACRPARSEGGIRRGTASPADPRGSLSHPRAARRRRETGRRAPGSLRSRCTRTTNRSVGSSHSPERAPVPCRPVSPLDSTSAMTARGTFRSAPFSTTRTRPGRSVTSIRDGEVKASDHGTSSPSTKVSTFKTTPSRARTVRAFDCAPTVAGRRANRAARRSVWTVKRAQFVLIAPPDLISIPLDNTVAAPRESLPGPTAMGDPVLLFPGPSPHTSAATPPARTESPIRSPCRRAGASRSRRAPRHGRSRGGSPSSTRRRTAPSPSGPGKGRASGRGGEPGALLEPLHERSGEAVPGGHRESGILDERQGAGATRTRRAPSTRRSPPDRAPGAPEGRASARSTGTRSAALRGLLGTARDEEELARDGSDTVPAPISPAPRGAGRCRRYNDPRMAAHEIACPRCGASPPRRTPILPGLRATPRTRLRQGQTCSTASTRSWTRSARAAWARSIRPATSTWTRSASSRSPSPTPLGEGPEPRRFQEEARMATLVRHPNVAALYDFSRLPDGSYYMVWEFIDGVTLEEWLRRHGPLPASQRPRRRAAGARGPRGDPRAGDRPSRPLARQLLLRENARRPARRQDHRPRHRQARRGGIARDDGDRPLPGQAQVLLARAGGRAPQGESWTQGATSTRSASSCTRCSRGARRSSRRPRRVPRKAPPRRPRAARHGDAAREHRPVPRLRRPAALEKKRDRRFARAPRNSPRARADPHRADASGSSRGSPARGADAPALDRPGASLVAIGGLAAASPSCTRPRPRRHHAGSGGAAAVRRSRRPDRRADVRSRRSRDRAEDRRADHAARARAAQRSPSIHRRRGRQRRLRRSREPPLPGPSPQTAATRRSDGRR